MFTKIQFLLSVLVSLMLLSFSNSQQQQKFLERTILDDLFGPLVNRFLGQSYRKVIGSTGDDPRFYEIQRKAKRVQEPYPESQKFFCDVNGAGRRGQKRPSSVHKLRPGDIDIIAAIGDSLTAGYGAFSRNILQVGIENKGVSAAIGGQETWRKFLTLPNILKEFNPKLYGYSLRDGRSSDRSSKFNVAEGGAMSRDIFHQANNLLKRMKNDPNVNMAEDWKLISIMIGPNDFCSDMCYYENPENVVEWHEQNLLKTLRFLRDRIPRVFVNLMHAPNVDILTRFTGKPNECITTHYIECSCFIGSRFGGKHKYYSQIINRWYEKEAEIAARDEFQKRDDFTVVVQPFASNLTLPINERGTTDFTYFASDCFHLSQKGYYRAALAMWNNILQRPNEKLTDWIYEGFKCPTETQPYLITLKNSLNR